MPEGTILQVFTSDAGFFSLGFDNKKYPKVTPLVLMIIQLGHNLKT